MNGREEYEARINAEGMTQAQEEEHDAEEIGNNAISIHVRELRKQC